MPLDTSKIKLPKSVALELSGKVKATSTIAALSKPIPQLFADKDYMVFNGASEAEVIGEGKQIGSYEQPITSVAGKRFKVVTTTRVSRELMWADKDARTEIVKAIIMDQAESLGRALDFVCYHAINPKDGKTLSGFTALTSDATSVTATSDVVADVDKLTDTLIDYDINGFALSRPYASELRKIRVPATGQRLYPEIPLSLELGNFDGITAACSGTVDAKKAETATKVKGIIGDFNKIRWGMVRDIFGEMIETGDPDGAGDLKRLDQVAYRTEAMFSYAVLDPKAFAVLKTA